MALKLATLGCADGAVDAGAGAVLALGDVVAAELHAAKTSATVAANAASGGHLGDRCIPVLL